MRESKEAKHKPDHPNNWILFFILIGYLIVGLFLLSLFRYHINTDVPSYIAIAEKYAHGHFRDAVNGFWSPLISWLMVPFILLGVDPLVAFKLIGIIAGLFAFIVIKNLLMDFSIPENVSTVLVISLIPAFYAFTLITVNPDFLLAVILMFYVRKVLAEDYGRKTSDGIICGFLGTMAYLAKGFALPFFISHFTAINLCRYYTTEEATGRKRVLTCFTLGMVTFFIFSSVWISFISIKEGRLIFNKAGAYNFVLMENSWQLSIEHSGFLPLPDPIAMSIWDDPSLIPVESKALPDAAIKIRRLASNVVRNLLHAIDTHQAGSIFSAAIILFSFLCLIGLSRSEWLGNKIFLILATMALYTSGYLPFLITRRYIYLNIFLLFTLGNYFLYLHDFHGKVRKAVAICCLCLSFMFMPLRDLRANASLGQDIHQFSMKLKKLGVSGRIASNGHLDDSIFASYYLRTKYFGIAKPGIADTELMTEFARHGINYYFCWKDQPCHGLLSIYPEISKGIFRHLRIYKVREETIGTSSSPEVR